MREAFKEIGFQRKTREMINLANSVIQEMALMGYTLTLRQLFYQLVSRDVIPNTQKSYKRLGEQLSDARIAGLVDWDAIEDRTRALRGVNHHADPEDIIGVAARSFRIDKWADQPERVEVWVEKDALVGVLEKACRPLDVDYFSCRGYTSQSAVYRTAKRMIEYFERGQQPVIIHLGDHDPSGMDMTRDIIDRLQMFVTGATGHEVTIERIALNMPQIIEYHPPPNPAKVTDSRYEGYIREHGPSSWELDALNPQVIDKLITDTVLKHRNEEQWEKDVQKEDDMRSLLRECSKEWEGVSSFLREPETYLPVQGGIVSAWDTLAALKPRLRRIFEDQEEITIYAEGTAVSVDGREFRKLLKPHKPDTSFKTKSQKKKK